MDAKQMDHPPDRHQAGDDAEPILRFGMNSRGLSALQRLFNQSQAKCCSQIARSRDFPGGELAGQLTTGVSRCKILGEQADPKIRTIRQPLQDRTRATVQMARHQ